MNINQIFSNNNLQRYKILGLSLGENHPYFEFFWSLLFRICTEYEDSLSKSPYSGIYGPEKTPNTSNFHTVYIPLTGFLYLGIIMVIIIGIIIINSIKILTKSN